MRLGILMLVCPLLAGCLAYGYPDISRTPAINIDSPDVRAFRITDETKMSGPVMTGPVRFERTAEEIPIVKAQVGSQHEAYLTYYYLAFPFDGSRIRNLKVLLYRSGYQVAEIRAHGLLEISKGEKPVQVVWQEATGLRAQMAALEHLVTNDPGHVAGKGLLEFAAAEYTRLANSSMAAAEGMEETRRELLGRAKECQTQAATR